MALQADGKIVAAGANSMGDFVLARYAADGALDGSFSCDGTQTTDFGANDTALGARVQADGKIVAAGTSSSGTAADFAVARYEGGGPPATCPRLPQTDPRPRFTFPFAGCPASTATVILGSAAGDTRNGTPGADRIFTAAGNDVVDGRAGNDCIDLGAGADRGGGGRGNDLMLGQSGGDRLSANSGRDRIRGGPGNDRITAGAGNDRALGNAGNDSLPGGPGRDRISGGTGGDVISGGGSSDRIAGDRGNERINGNTGRDRLSGNAGNDRIRARDRQRDQISCGSGRDTVTADRSDRVARNCERVRRV